MIEDLLKKTTTKQQRGAMNGGLAKQIFRKARSHLDASLDLHDSNLNHEEMCTLKKNHLLAACQELASYVSPPLLSSSSSPVKKQAEASVSKSWF